MASRLLSGRRMKSWMGLCVEPLERRQMLSVVELAPILPSFLGHSDAPQTDSIDLTTHFIDSDVEAGGSVARFETSLGTFNVALTDKETPITVQNFANYANRGEYNNTFFHRSFVLSSSTGGSPTTPADIIQAGGYFVSGGKANHIGTFAPIVNEVATEVQQNVVGTIAMAKTSDPDSATSEFFFNVHDNAGLDDPNNSGGFTTFGHVIGGGIGIVNQIAALPTVDFGGAFATLPVTDTSNPGSSLVFENISIQPDVTFTTGSDNDALVRPSISGHTLSFRYAAGKSGTANVTVTAKSFDGTQFSRTFAVTIPDPVTPGAGPKANDDAPPPMRVNTSVTFTPADNDTDSVSPLQPSSITFVTQPTHGTLSFSSFRGVVTYTPAQDFTGTDSFQYTITDENGDTSVLPATVNLTVNPVTVDFGTASQRVLIVDEPDGTHATLIVAGGTAAVTFAGTDVQLSTTRGVVTASGTQATIDDITITNATNRSAILFVRTTGGDVTLGSIHDNGPVSAIIAPNGSITGDVKVSGLGRLFVSSILNSSIDLGSDIHDTIIFANDVENTNLHSSTNIKFIRSQHWLSTTGFEYTINATAVGVLLVPGEFANSMTLTSTGDDALAVNIGSVTGGTWTATGVIHSLVLGSVASAWSLTSQNLVNLIRVKGNLSSSITAGAIGTLLVGGDFVGGKIVTDASISAGFFQLGRLIVVGNMTNSVVQGNGNLGVIVAKSITGSDIVAGADLLLATNHQLPSSLSSFFANARLAAVISRSGFSDSRITAANIGTLQLGQLTLDDPSGVEGVATHIISLLAGTLDTGKRLVLGRVQLKSQTALSAFLTKAAIDLRAFQVKIL
jgi:cyclophilin family peptidyl-prolyl cis-trans isomerase